MKYKYFNILLYGLLIPNLITLPFIASCSKSNNVEDLIKTNYIGRMIGSYTDEDIVNQINSTNKTKLTINDVILTDITPTELTTIYITYKVEGKNNYTGSTEINFRNIVSLSYVEFGDDLSNHKLKFKSKDHYYIPLIDLLAIEMLNGASIMFMTMFGIDAVNLTYTDPNNNQTTLFSDVEGTITWNEDEILLPSYSVIDGIIPAGYEIFIRGYDPWDAFEII